MTTLKMNRVKLHVLYLTLIFLSKTIAQDEATEESSLLTTTEDSKPTNEVTNDELPSNPSEDIPLANSPGVNPFFGIRPNGFPNFFTNFLRPTKFGGKTYGPNIIAIIGDKPYISMEIFNKFSPFKWLMTAFQGKIQNLCGFLAPPLQPDLPPVIPQNIIQQLMDESQKPPSGAPQSPIKVYNLPASAFYRNSKMKT